MMELMDDIYSLRIEVSAPGQLELIDHILEVEHNVISDCWEFQMEYDPNFGELPAWYFNNFVWILEGKYGDLEKIGIMREDISVWRCIRGAKDVFMQYWPEEIRMLSSLGIKFCIVCRVLDEDEDIMPHYGGFTIAN